MELVDDGEVSLYEDSLPTSQQQESQEEEFFR